MNTRSDCMGSELGLLAQLNWISIFFMVILMCSFSGGRLASSPLANLGADLKAFSLLTLWCSSRVGLFLLRAEGVIPLPIESLRAVPMSLGIP